MLQRDYPDQVCSIARSLEVIGERWTLLIVRDAVPGRDDAPKQARQAVYARSRARMDALTGAWVTSPVGSISVRLPVIRPGARWTGGWPWVHTEGLPQSSSLRWH